MRLLLAALLCTPILAQAATLSVCTEASPEGFDVVQYNSLTTTNAAADMLMNRLVEFDAEQGKLLPSLARSWSISADGLVYDFTLRDDVQFHHSADFSPSRTLDAQDVLFSFQRMLDEQHPWHAIAVSGYPHAQSMQWPSLIAKIEAPDAHRVRITLNRRDATFLATLSMGFASIYSAEYADQLMAAGTPQKLNSAPIGSGPFAFERFQKDAVVRYRANPEYFAGKPGVNRVIFAITPDSNVRLQKLRRGECQIALSPKPQDVQAIATNAKLKSAQTAAFMTAFVGINSQHPPLDKPQVRQAINLAFDKASYVKAVFEGSAEPANGPYPPNTWSYASELPGYAHDPAKARALLAEAGLTNGFKTTIWAPTQRQPAQSQPEPRRAVAAGGSGQGGHRCRNSRDRVGRANPPRQGRRARPAVHGLGWRQRRSGQLPHPAVRLRLGAVRAELRPLLRRNAGQADRGRQGQQRPGSAQPPLSQGAADHSGAGAVAAVGPPHRLRVAQ